MVDATEVSELSVLSSQVNFWCCRPPWLTIMHKFNSVLCIFWAKNLIKNECDMTHQCTGSLCSPYMPMDVSDTCCSADRLLSEIYQYLKLIIWNVSLINANNSADFVEKKRFTWLVKVAKPGPWNELPPHLGSCVPLCQQSELILV